MLSVNYNKAEKKKKERCWEHMTQPEKIDCDDCFVRVIERKDFWLSTARLKSGSTYLQLPAATLLSCVTWIKQHCVEELSQTLEGGEFS